MAAVDTNVLVRWLVRDDGQQEALVAALISGVVDRGEPLAIPCYVSLELDWVLRSRYRLDREAVLLRVRSSGGAGAMRRAPSATAGRTATLGQWPENCLPRTAVDAVGSRLTVFTLTIQSAPPGAGRNGQSSSNTGHADSPESDGLSGPLAPPARHAEAPEAPRL